MHAIYEVWSVVTYANTSETLVRLMPIFNGTLRFDDEDFEVGVRGEITLRVIDPYIAERLKPGQRFRLSLESMDS